MDPDPRLRALYRLAEVAEGDAAERVRAAIVARRSELELDAVRRLPSAWDGLPDEEVAQEPVREKVFTPAPADAVPVGVKRPGERGYRIVGTRRRD